MDGQLLYWGFIAGTAVAAASGGLLAAEKGFDVVGAVFLSIAVGIGGGTLVDVLSGVLPVRWVVDPLPLAVSAVFGGLVFYLAWLVNRITRALDWLDGMALALLTPAILQYCLEIVPDQAAAAVLAILGACGGGIIRDTLANRDPLVFSGELYVTAVAAGISLYYLMQLHPVTTPFAPLACGVLTGALRGAAMIFRLRLTQGRISR